MRTNIMINGDAFDGLRRRHVNFTLMKCAIGSWACVAVLLVGLNLLGMPLATFSPVDSSTTRTATNKVFTYSEPPDGFNPLSASDAELAKYGFPPRPDSRVSPALYDQWRRLVSVPRRGRPVIRSTKIYNGAAQVPRPAEP